MLSSYEILAVHFLYYQGILQIGRFIFQDFYRIPGDNELVASVNGLVQILNKNYQHFSN